MKNRDISTEFLIYKCEALRYLRTSFPLPLLVWITQVLRALSSSQGHSLCCWSWICRGACEGAWYARQFPAQVKTRQEKNISSVAFLRAEITSTVSVLLPPTPLFSLGRETEKKAAKLPCLCNQFLFNGICCNSKVHHLKVLLYYYFFSLRRFKYFAVFAKRDRLFTATETFSSLLALSSATQLV